MLKESEEWIIIRLIIRLIINRIYIREESEWGWDKLYELEWEWDIGGRRYESFNRDIGCEWEKSEE